MRITRARITDMPKHLFDKMPEVYATLEDGTEVRLFEYYPDEISFTPGEFVGLSVAEAKDLRRQKDLKFLQS